MADLPWPVMRSYHMSAINNVVAELTPALEELVAYLAVSSQSEAFDFFSHVQQRLGQVAQEEELLEVFIVMSMLAFQGFRLDPWQACWQIKYWPMRNKCLTHFQLTAAA